jgi:hypothetical protein
MRQAIPFVLVILLCVLTPSLLADTQYKYIHASDTDLYFGHISFTETKFDGRDPIVVREGKSRPEVAVVNLPLAPGDTIQTTESRRCEIQFDTGTIVRLGYNSALKIETIMAHSLSERKKISNLVLLNGHAYFMYKRYSRGEIFQVITPNAAVKLNNSCVVFINARKDGSTDVQAKEGKVHVLYGTDKDNLDKTKVKKSQVLTVLANDTAVRDSYAPDAEFESWNVHMNENFMALHEGRSFIPKPILKYPESVVNFAQKYGSRHGEWSWNSLYGYVWRPYYNELYPWGNWQPYMYGHWYELDSQLFWVPDEPWGWVPYHLGLWMWDKDLGWIWIPGDAFAPAWVAWDYLAGFYFWRPWGFYDWLWGSYNYGSYYSSFGYSPFWAGGGTYPTYPGSVPEKEKDVLRTIDKDQLKKPDKPPKVPKKLKRTYKNIAKAMKNKDQRVLDSLREVPNQILAVKGRDINATRIHKHALKLETFSKENFSRDRDSLQHGNPSRAAVIEYRGNEIIASIREGLTLQQRINRVIQPVQSVQDQRRAHKTRINGSKFKMRIRDWNPDVKAALRSKVNIRYSSRTNEIHCPELNLSSRGFIASKVRIYGGGLSSSGSQSSLSSSSSSTGRSASSGARMSSSNTSTKSVSSGSGKSRKK